jgi:hypothetical protein
MNHAIVTELADQKISSFYAEADAARLARSARHSKTGTLRRRQKILRLAVGLSSLQK